MNLFETFVNNVVPPEYRRQFKEGIQQGKKDFVQATNNIVSNTIGATQDAINYFQSGEAAEDGQRFLDYMSDLSEDARKYIMEHPAELAITIATFFPWGKAARVLAKPLSNAFKAGGMAKVVNAMTKTFKPKTNFVLKGGGTTTVSAERATKDLGVLGKTPRVQNNLVSPNNTTARGSLIPYNSGIARDARSVDQFVRYINSTGRANKSTAQYVDGLKKAAGGINGVKNELVKNGEKITKDDIPRLQKFINQLGSLLKNSPANVLHLNGILDGVNTGLTLFDMWQAFKEGGDTLIPKAVANTGRGLGSFFAKNPLTKIVYSSLGYLGGAGIGGLAQAGLQKLGIIETDPDYKNGYARRNLEQDVSEEYMQGASGRKYHRVGDKIYDFATGRPVRIQDALVDIDQYNRSQKQAAQDAENQAARNLEDKLNLKDMGYNISNAEIQEAYNLYQNARNINSMTPETNYSTNYQIYDPEGDLVEQYYQQNIAPQQQQAQMQAQVEQANRLDQYKQIFNKIANDTYADVEAYYGNPENLAIEYFQNQSQVASGLAPALTPEQFARIQKAKAMYQLGPQIRDKALSITKQFQDYEINLGQLNVNQGNLQRNIMKDYGTYQKNLADIEQKQQQLEETRRHNLNTENVDMYRAKQYGNYVNIAGQNAQTNRNRMLIDKYNAETNRQRERRQQSLQPFVQAELMGGAISGATAGGMGLTPDQFLNTNQSVLQNVFPNAYNNNQQGSNR